MSKPKSKIDTITYTYVDSKDNSIICDFWYYTFKQREKHYLVGDEQTHSECRRRMPKQVIETRTRTKHEWLVIL